MMIIRPIEAKDYDGLHQLAQKTGPGFTSLQDDEEQVRAKLEHALEAYDPTHPDELAYYLFVLEDTATGNIAGVCGIEAAVGLTTPWYNYRVGTVVQTSKELNVYNKYETLYLSNDYTGYSELCTLFLDPEYRQGRNGHLLSKSRFLFIAEHCDKFDRHLIAEMRGVSDEQGISPFWEGLGRHFFNIDFEEADLQCAKDKVFIAELMPKHPIYTNLLPQDVREAISHTHRNTTPARVLLEREGLRYTGMIDIFDGGPVLEAQTDDVRAIHDSRFIKVKINDQLATELAAKKEWPYFLLSNTAFENYRCTTLQLAWQDKQTAIITQETATALQLKDGATARTVELFPSDATR